MRFLLTADGDMIGDVVERYPERDITMVQLKPNYAHSSLRYLEPDLFPGRASQVLVKDPFHRLENPNFQMGT